MCNLLEELARDCPWRRTRGASGRQIRGECGAYLPDLDGPPRPADLPLAMRALRVIAGGKR